MLPGPHRLRLAADFQRTVRRGRRTSTATIVVHALAGEDRDPARVGFVVSKAVGGAVVRNRVKRRLRSAMRPHLDGMRGLLLVIRANPAAAAATFATVSGDLQLCLAKVRPAAPSAAS